MNLCGNELVSSCFVKPNWWQNAFFNSTRRFQGRVEHSAFPSMPTVENCFFDVYKSLSSLLKSLYFMLTILSDLSIGSAIYIYTHMHMYACILFFLLTSQYSNISVPSCRLWVQHLVSNKTKQQRSLTCSTPSWRQYLLLFWVYYDILG